MLAGRCGHTRWPDHERPGRRWILGISPAIAMFVLAAGCTSGTAHDAGSAAGTVAVGTPWTGVFTSIDLPIPVNSLTDVSCPTVSRCWATGLTVGADGAPNGAAIVASRNGGASWTPDAIPGAVGYLSAISCRTASDCVAVGQTGASLGTLGLIVATTDGGRTWSAQPPISGTTDVTVVTCLPNGRCLAIATGAAGAVGVVTTGPDVPWQTVGALPVGITGATGVSCADDHDCWVTDVRPVDVDHGIGTVSYTTDFGANWTQESVPFGTGSLGGIDCASGPASSGSLPFSSSSSTPATTPAGAPVGAPVAATTTTTVPASTTTTLPGLPGFECTVVGTTATTLNGARTGHGVIITTTNGGSTWTPEPVPATAAAFTDVSCPVTGSCVVVGTSLAATPEAGLVVLTGHVPNVWKRADSVAVSQPVAAVSCPTLGHCVMAGETVSERLDVS